MSKLKDLKKFLTTWKSKHNKTLGTTINISGNNNNGNQLHVNDATEHHHTKNTIALDEPLIDRGPPISSTRQSCTNSQTLSLNLELEQTSACVLCLCYNEHYYLERQLQTEDVVCRKCKEVAKWIQESDKYFHTHKKNEDEKTYPDGSGARVDPKKDTFIYQCGKNVNSSRSSIQIQKPAIDYNVLRKKAIYWKFSMEKRDDWNKLKGWHFPYMYRNKAKCQRAINRDIAIINTLRSCKQKLLNNVERKQSDASLSENVQCSADSIDNVHGDTLAVVKHDQRDPENHQYMSNKQKKSTKTIVKEHATNTSATPADTRTSQSKSTKRKLELNDCIASKTIKRKHIDSSCISTSAKDTSQETVTHKVKKQKHHKVTKRSSIHNQDTTTNVVSNQIHQQSKQRQDKLTTVQSDVIRKDKRTSSHSDKASINIHNKRQSDNHQASKLGSKSEAKSNKILPESKILKQKEHALGKLSGKKTQPHTLNAMQDALNCLNNLEELEQMAHDRTISNDIEIFQTFTRQKENKARISNTNSLFDNKLVPGVWKKIVQEHK